MSVLPTTGSKSSELKYSYAQEILVTLLQEKPAMKRNV